MDQDLNREKVEKAISDCNTIMKNWFFQQKYYLINEHEIKGALFNRLKIYCGIWREQKMFLKMLRINIVNAQIDNITLIDIGDPYGYRLKAIFNSIFDSINYKALTYPENNKSSLKDLKQSLEEETQLNINFNSIENIKF